MLNLKVKSSSNLKLCLILFSLFFTIFLFTSDGHRYTFDEDLAFQQSKRIATFSPDPSYVQGESRAFFEYPWLYPPDSYEYNQRAICQNAILCSHATVIHSLTQAPFIFVNHHFGFITASDIWTQNDFDDFHYVSWRNDMDPDMVFMEIFYGPLFSALSVCVLFLISKTYGFSIRTSLILVFLYGLTTIAWAYSQTSLNSVPVTFFLLSGFFFYRKFKITNSNFYLILTGIIFGVAFLTRNDMVLIFIPFFILLLVTSFRKHTKLKTMFAFSIPLILTYTIHKLIGWVRDGEGALPITSVFSSNSHSPLADIGVIPLGLTEGVAQNPYLLQLFGILFSPGAGLFIYAPILFASFVGFFDFYKKNKSDCILFLSFVGIFVLFFAAGSNWHGFNGWGTRYLLPVIPFLMIPIAASIEKRMHFSFKIPVILLGITGFLINLVYLLQDVSYFVWGLFGSDERGLYSLARKAEGGVFDLWINPVIIWTFEFSQIVQSTMMLLAKPQLDLFLFKILGIELFLVCLVSTISILFYMLVKLSRNYTVEQKL